MTLNSFLCPFFSLGSIGLNSLPNDRILDQSNFLKVFAAKNINWSEELKFVVERVENIVGKGENAGDQHFTPFPTMFSKALFSWSIKVGTVW